MPDVEEEETDTVQRAYEALEIFALLAEDQRHNESADLLLAVWPDYGARWLELLPFWRLGGGFRVGCKTCVEMPDSVMVWAQLYVFPRTSEETTARHARLRRAVGDAFSIASAASIAACAVPVHLGICVNGADPADASQILQEALPVVTIQYLVNRADIHNAFSPRVVLTDVWLMEDISGDDMPNIDRISAVGVRVPRLPMYTTSLEETSAVYYVHLLRRLFASIPQVPPALGSSALEVFSTMDQYTAASVFSAVLGSRSIRDMRVAKSCGDMAPPSIKIWPWLALSVFSRFATNRLECVTIDITNLSIENVAAIESIVRAPNPLGAFLKNEHQTEAFATASRFWFSTNAGEGPDLFLGSDTLELRVIDDRQEEWIGVLLPGHGQSWVRRSECQLSTDISPSTLAHWPLQEISLRGVNVDTSSSALMLLRVIGGSVKRLALEGEEVDVTLPEQWYWKVLRACPALEAFEMRRLDVGSLDIYSGAFDRGITSINQLSLQLTGPAPNDDVAVAGAALHRMLSNNYYMQDVVVTLKCGATTAAGDFTEGVEKPAFEKYNGDPVHGRRGPLRIRSKLAFLSVLERGALQRDQGSKRQQSDRSANRAMWRLDNHVVTLIFQLAAESKLRHVKVAIGP